MKCAVCGEENPSRAKFCNNCGSPLKAASGRNEEDSYADSNREQSYKDSGDSDYQPRRMPKIGQEESSDRDEPQGKVFMFEEERRAQTKRSKGSKRKAVDDDDIFDDDDDAEYAPDDDDEESTGRGGRIFVAVISLVTLLVLVGGGLLFLYVTPTGGRLRASMGLSAGATEYKYLADWQLENGNEADAASSYYTAFLKNQNDYAFALDIAKSFERCHATDRAEQLYMYLIDNYPLENEPYENLMALLMREGKEDEYNGLLYYRAEKQPGYVVPTPAVEVTPPTANPAAGTYTGSVHITLTAGEGASIYFTTDGTDPSRASRLYTGPIILYSGNYTIRAIAYEGESASEVIVEAYTIS